jgi:acetyltransferase-like isoleucine patch superfamily enzyme
MNYKRMSLLARGYIYAVRQRLAGGIINKVLDVLAWSDIRILAFLSMWHPSMDYRIKYLKKRGVNVGEHVHVDLGVIIEFTTPQAVYIEDYVGIGYGAQIIAHDAGPNDIVDLPMRVRETRIGYNTAIGSYAIIMPGVKIGRNCGIVAGSVVTKNVPDGTVWGGNPARKLFDVPDVVLGWQAGMKQHPELYYDHPNENRAPSTPFDHLVTWREEGVKIQPTTNIRTGLPFDYILDAKAMEDK